MKTKKENRVQLSSRLERTYCPMSETAFYILWFLQKENHGYSISQQTEQLSGGQVTISPGTMYGSLSKMETDGLIEFVRQEGKRKLYRNTALGNEILQREIRRIERLYLNSRGLSLTEDQPVQKRILNESAEMETRNNPEKEEAENSENRKVDKAYA